VGRVVIGDEIWVYQYDPETKRQNAHWKTANSPRPKKKSVSPNHESENVADFFYINGIVSFESVPTGQTVNQVYYLEVLEILREKFRKKRPEYFANTSWSLLHENAPAHKALSVREYLGTKQITVLEYPAYSPGLAPVTFFCSRR
jgi:hypothetical protein